jgi:hypothetical protein
MINNRVCIIGSSGLVSTNLIKAIASKNIFIDFISYKQEDIMNPSFKNGFNNIKVTLISSDTSVKEILANTKTIINLSIIPTMDNFGSHLNNKILQTKKLAQYVNKEATFIQVLPFIKNDKGLLDTKISETLLEFKKHNIQLVSLYSCVLLSLEDSIIKQLAKSISIYNKKINFNKDVRFSILEEDEFIANILKIIQGEQDSKWIVLGSSNQVSLIEIQNEVIKQIDFKITKCAIPFFIISLINSYLKLGLLFLNKNYYKFLSNSQEVNTKSSTISYKISLTHLVKKYLG